VERTVHLEPHRAQEDHARLTWTHTGTILVRSHDVRDGSSGQEERRTESLGNDQLHETKARYALDEFALFDDAIGEAKQLLKSNGVLDETLLVVTADHSHVFTMGAESARGSNILGFGTLEQKNVSDVDRMPVNILAYGNGPNYQGARNKNHFDSVNTNTTSYLSPAAIPMKSETHGGEDVPVYAQGPWSHLFIGTMEQHTIAHKMAYAACWGDYQNRDGCKSAAAIRAARMRPFKSNGMVLPCPSVPLSSAFFQFSAFFSVIAASTTDSRARQWFPNSNLQDFSTNSRLTRHFL
jgi:hypothetical protein